MAGGGDTITIRNYNDSTTLYESGLNTSDTIGDILGLSWNSGGAVTALAISIGGTPLPNDTIIVNSGAYVPGRKCVFYDVTPQAETITGFYLDGTEYKFGGGGTDYTAGNGIDITNDEIGLDGTYEGKDYSAMQGPAPDGFHVPLSSEWTAVKTIWTTLGGGSSDGTNFGISLKLPMAGYRDYSTSNITDQGTNGRYWSSSRYNVNYAYYLYFNSSNVGPQYSNYRALGLSVRGFKDSPVIPDGTWTTLKSGTGSAGIFWSSTLGLISMSGDGTTWITIADKNLGATTVWNSGDTLSEANCGYYYQRGNNYGFAWTGTISNTSTTQVNASTYGPGNYYSSSTFIKYSGRWDTTDNGNLWGGVTGIQTVSGNLVLGDKLYKIVTSTTAPASGTASNIITIVTD